MKNLESNLSKIRERIQELELRWWQLEDRIDLMTENHYQRNSPEVKELSDKQKSIENDIYLIIDTVGADEFIKSSIPTLCFNQ